MLITLDNVTFSYGGNLIFENVSFALNEGERVGLIGANGEGKTTLIRLVLGELSSDNGTVVKKNGLKIGYLEQNGGYQSGNTVYGEMLEIFKEELGAVQKLSTLSAELANAQSEHEFNVLSVKIESLNKFLTARDCFDVEVKIKTVLNGMGFNGMYQRVIDTMSGGEKTRLKLARLLLENPDLLILDEPTNHLDITTLFWLEEYLQSFKGAIFVVSHDRYFLDKTVSRILEIENKRLTSFSGNYSKYKILKAELYERQLKEYLAQQEERAKLQDYVDRNIVRATTAKSAQSRVKQLERMEILEKPFTPPKPPTFNFNFEIQPYEQVLEVSGLNLERGGKQLISNGAFSVKRGNKIALVGENGTGKSTLLKEIYGGKNPAVKAGRYVRFAYYDQETAILNGENTVLAELWERHVGYTQTEARSALARCGLFAEDMDKPVKSLSGGERAKLALCVLECEKGNVLLMDEPTNHLDLPAREGLEAALKKFEGTLVFVSHDRYFISALAENILEIEGGKLNFFEGGYDSFTSSKKLAAEQLKAKEQAEKQTEREKERANSYRSKKERAEDERRKQLIKKLESDISACEQEEEQINNLLAKPGIASDYVRVNELLKELEAIKLHLDELYKQYEDVLQ